MAIPLLHQMGVTFGVGASTFALIFYIQATQDGAIDASERRFLHTVFTVLRIGMACIIATILFSGTIYYLGGFPILQNPLFLMETLLISIIVFNAVLMQYRHMPMWLGPSLAGGSWYSIFLLQSLPLENQSFPMLVVFYVLFVAVFYSVYTIIKKRFTNPTPLAKPAEVPAVVSEIKSVEPALKE